MAQIEDVKVGDTVVYHTLVYRIGSNLVYRYKVQEIVMTQNGLAIGCVVLEHPEGKKGALRVFNKADIEFLEIE